MSKNKLKLSLIDDYIKIITIKNFIQNPLLEEKDKTSFSNLSSSIKQLENIYNLVFEKVNLNNNSLLVLKQELKENQVLFNQFNQGFYSSKSLLFEKINQDVNQIFNNLNAKIKQLKINMVF